MMASRMVEVKWHTFVLATMPLFSDYKAEPYGHLYSSLTKEYPLAEELTNLPKRGVGALCSVSILTMKELPCHVYSDLMPSKQIIGQIIAYIGTTSSFEVES